MQPAAETSASPLFSELALKPELLRALQDVGYESPSPIQAATIPPLLEGRDLVGQAQTGTGKTAAFALPILSRLDLSQTKPQALVLTPTRELAIQVAEAFQRYAVHLPGFHVLPIYGGQSYTPQLHSLRRGVHVVVGTPGRVTDHLKRGTLNLSGLSNLVLDEADEMLRMGFIDDVEWILEQAPKKRQVALFSATMPAPIRRIAQRHLHEPVEITIKSKTSTATNIRQRYWMVSGMHKLDALTRILEVEPFDGMLVFTRTKQSTEELAERLSARGFSAEALNGDIPQAQRERTVARLKNNQVDIVVATDVAARGLDVERISHVINFDVPYDSESYVHRIGRTGRAGRSGDAIIFIAPRERNMLHVIERATRQPIEQMQMPSMDAVNDQRIARFKQKIADALANGNADKYRFIVEQFTTEHGVSAVDVAAALITMAQGRTPLLVERAERTERESHDRKPDRKPSKPMRADHDTKFTERAARPSESAAPARPRREDARESSRDDRPKQRPRTDERMETYRVEVGHAHGVQPGNIVGAIANEAGIEGRLIGRIEIRDDHSLVDLPEGMPKEIFRDLKKARVAGRELQISYAKLRSGGPLDAEREAAVRNERDTGTHTEREAGTRSERELRPRDDRPPRKPAPAAHRGFKPKHKGRDHKARR